MPGWLSIICATCFWSITGIFIKLSHLPAVDKTFFRTAVPLLLILLVHYRAVPAILTSGSRALFALALLNLLRMFLIIVAYEYVEASRGIVLIYTFPLFSLLISRFWLREILPLRQYAAGLCGFAGILVMYGFEARGLGQVLGFSLLASSALIYAGMNVAAKRMLRTIGVLDLNFFYNLPALLLLPVVSAGTAKYNPEDYYFAILLGLFSGYFAFTLYFKGLKTTEITTAAILTYLEVPLAVLWSVLFLGERLSPQFFFGLALILASNLLLIQRKNKKTALA